MRIDDIIITIRGNGEQDRARYFDFLRWYRDHGCCRIRLFNGFTGAEINCVREFYSTNLAKEHNDPQQLYGRGPWAFTLNFPIDDIETAVWVRLKF